MKNIVQEDVFGRHKLERLKLLNEILYLVVLDHFVCVFEETRVGRSDRVGASIDIDEVGSVAGSIGGVLSQLEVKIISAVLVFILSVDF